MNKILILLSILFYAGNIIAEQKRIKVYGSIKTHLIAEKNVSSLTSLRLNGHYRFSENNSVDIGYNFSTEYRHEMGNEVEDNRIEYRIADLEKYPNKDLSENIILYQNLDRLIWERTSENYDLYLGRQAISNGHGKMSNPTDVFLPYPIGTIDSEYRSGVDALRIKKMLRNDVELDLGLVFGEKGKKDKNAMFLNISHPILNWENTFTIINYRENSLFGFDLQGSLFKQGFWLEASVNQMREESGYKQKFLRYVVGMDYKINNDIIIYSEYQYNGAGESDKLKYANVASHLSYSEAGVFFLGENYFSPGVSYTFSPLIIYTANIIYNIDDKSSFSSFNAEWNLKEDFYASILTYIPLGDSNSEYSTFQNHTSLSVRYYF